MTVKDQLGMIVELTKLNNLGSLFGDESLLQDPNSRYEATVTCLVETVAFRLPRKNIDKFLHISGELGGELRRAAMEKTSVKSISKRIEVFQDLSEQKQHLMAALCQMVIYNEGEVLSRQGKMPRVGRGFLIVANGSLDVIIDGKTIRTLNPGDYFGEVGIVTNKPHSATVKASKRCTCIVIERDDFRALFVDEPSIIAEFALKVYAENIDFATFVRHKRGRKSFMEFCETEYAEENMDFVVRVEEIENIAKRKMRKDVLDALNINIEAMKNLKKNLIDTKCKGIIESYIKDDSPRQISMSAETKASILKRYNNNDFSSDMFDSAKELVMNILETDNFTRYKSSELFKEFLRTIGTYY